MHLFSGPVDMEAYASAAAVSERPITSSERVSVADLAQRVGDLEQEVAELRQLLETLI